MRQKEIQFSSRTRAATDQYKRAQKLRIAFPVCSRRTAGSSEVKMLAAEADEKVCNIVQLIYNTQNYEGIVNPSFLGSNAPSIAALRPDWRLPARSQHHGPDLSGLNVSYKVAQDLACPKCAGPRG
ncbi:DUF3734 domain-containing protein [Bradyrhizobium sp. JYMT SZCCT0180]|uniref:DUF3734 domain-containing protein n=1 Tax=Bradyrhizobium sp. JYMT SZCCT0180 TaxID=2807666 RepID=UPI0032DE901C